MILSEYAITGWFFIGAAALIWFGWIMTPARIGTFFKPDDFERVHRSLRRWIWLFRFHLFGYVMAVMALVSLGAMYSGNSVRLLIWPAVAVCAAGLFVSALAQAFYYHFGAWGALDMHGKSEEVKAGFVESLHVTTEYVSCLVRFGRVFFGLGQVVLALGFLALGVSIWVTLATALLGVAAMALTMGLPDDLDYYHPVFHLNALWFLVAGVSLIRSWTV